MNARAHESATLVHRRPLASIRVERLTCAIGAELRNVSLAAVIADDELFKEIKALLLQHKVLFLRNQNISPAEHVAFARRFGALEDHPVAGSDPDHPGLVRIYKDLDTKEEHYENAYHCDATWREAPPMGCVLRCVECPEVGGDTIWVNMAEAYRRLPEPIKSKIAGLLAHVLEDLGYVVDTAKRVSEKKALLSKRVYDLVITDERLPDGSGRAIADMARSKGALVVILTGYGREAPEHDYLFKPIRADELARAVQRYLGTETLT